MSKHRTKITIALLVLMLASLACAVPGLQSATATPEPTPTPTPNPRSVTITSIEGTVEVRGTEGVYVAAQTGQALGVGDEIRTYAASTAVLALDDGTVMVISENSTFSVTELSGSVQSPISRFFLNIGSVFSFHNGDLPSGAAYEVETPAGVAAIRGSSVGVSHGIPSTGSTGGAFTRPAAQIGGESHITCLEGTCDATSDGGHTGLNGGEAVDIMPNKQLGPVGPMSPDDYSQWHHAFDMAGDQLGGFNPDELFPVMTPDVYPDVVGMTVQDAQSQLDSMGIQSTVVDSKPCVNVNEGEVTSQDPQPGTPYQDGTTVELIECTGPPSTGDVQVTLTWSTTDDLDLDVYDPQGNDIYYGQTSSPTGGQLDVDANGYCNPPLTANPVENVYWPFGSAPSGTYTVYVYYSINCGQSPHPVDYTVTVTVDGSTQTYNGTLNAEGDYDEVTTFTR